MKRDQKPERINLKSALQLSDLEKLSKVPITERGFFKSGQANMAPQQQNSTFIDDNLDSCPSLLNLPESPILPPRRCQNQDTNNNNNNKQPFEERLVDESLSVGEPPLAPPIPIPMPIPMAPAPPHRQACKNKHGRENGNAGQASRRHRSISLYGVNSTVEQGHKEIPIWMDDGEARYVSGVTNKTTCDDIIKALIDDELRNGDGLYCGNNPKDGGQRKAAAASRDYSDYIITESWGGIERCYDGNMAILPVWRAWSRVHNEVMATMAVGGPGESHLACRKKGAK